MLNTIREKTQGIIATFILSLLVIPFALWGINSYFETGRETSVAKIDGKDISQAEFRNAMERVRGQLDAATLESPAFKQMILSSLIEQTLLAMDAEKNGYRISDANLGKMIRDIPIFQRDGQFDPALYETLLRREGMSPRQFESRLRTEQATRQVQLALTDSAFATDGEVVALAQLMSQERTVSVATVGPESFLKSITVSGEDIQKHYDTSTEQYKTTEQVRVQYVELKAVSARDSHVPDDAELKRAYEQDLARFITPEKRRIGHILITVSESATAEEKQTALVRAQEIEKKLRGGADFEALARQVSQDPDSAKKGGDLGEVRPGVLPKPIEQASLALRLREVSAPVRSDYGYHVIKVTALTPEKRRSLADVKAELTKRILQKRAEERFIDQSEKLRNLVYEHPDSLEMAANTLELDVRTSDWFTRSGGTGIAKNLKVVEAAFHPEILNRSRNSDVIESDAQTLIAVRVMDHRPSTRRPLDEVRAEIERTLRDQMARGKAAAAAVAAVKALSEGGKISDVADLRGITFTAEKKISRERTLGVDRRVADAVFQASKPEENKPVFGSVDLGSQGFAIFQLREVTDVAADKVDSATKEKARRQIVERRGQGFYGTYRSGLRAGAKVTVSNDRL